MSKDIKAYLINESNTTSQPEVVQDNNKSVRFIAELQEADRQNRNGRVYRKDVIQSGLDSPVIQEKLARRTFYGESGHPLSDEPKRQMYIDQRNISHIVTRTWWNGNKLMGEVETAQTAAGKDMKGLIGQKSDVSFSMRGFSKINRTPSGEVEVTKPLRLICYDWVVIPSHQDSYIQNIISEGHNNYNPNDLQMVNESIDMFANGKITEFSPREVLTYIKENSDNVKYIAEDMGFAGVDESNISYDKGSQLASIRESNKTIKVFLEESVLNGLDDFYRNFK
ncbi:hypothetical protein PALS2_150 [Staphylococcus phage PALS_2]|nr:hypothetical protein PALS2_150 [Staphylococcus phage PALS_2]